MLSTRLRTEAASFAIPRSGLAAARTGYPSLRSFTITSDQLPESAHAPCTSTIVGFFPATVSWAATWEIAAVVVVAFVEAVVEAEAGRASAVPVARTAVMPRTERGVRFRMITPR